MNTINDSSLPMTPHLLPCPSWKVGQEVRVRANLREESGKVGRIWTPEEETIRPMPPTDRPWTPVSPTINHSWRTSQR